MNLKDLDPSAFIARTERYAEEVRASFSRNVEERLNEFKRSLADVSEWKGVSDVMPKVVMQWLSLGATIFTVKIPTPGAHRIGGHDERDVRLNFDGYDVVLGRTRNVSEFYGARVILIVLPEVEEKKT